MPYTLTMGLLWVVLAVVLGIVLGWLLRSVAARRQVERVRAEANDESEMARLRSRVAGLDSVVNERDRLRIELGAALAAGGAPVTATAGSTGGDQASESPGIASDDLTAVVGIDDDVAELCRTIGIDTWAELSVTEVSLLKTMLTDAGRSLADHDPSSWPEQARLLAAGSWAEFELRFLGSVPPQVDG